jgi:hypothetical protein
LSFVSPVVSANALTNSVNDFSLLLPVDADLLAADFLVALPDDFAELPFFAAIFLDSPF